MMMTPIPKEGGGGDSVDCLWPGERILFRSRRKESDGNNWEHIALLFPLNHARQCFESLSICAIACSIVKVFTVS